MIYRRTGERLRPAVIRVASSVMRRRWRGLDPDEVYEFLRLVAKEVERLEREATTARTQAERVRQGLRQWQARHIGCTFADPSAADFQPSSHPRPGTGRRLADSGEQDQRQPRNGGHW
ncbi:DivIVA domain-containing protein [Plantactinospora sp. KLBMP9567]|uniref:DivIVA domain-containing protein n=1 Tax=Plantactinospora sp. KLBMP9567 TaxID=3085900 RepID=UPI00298294D2|nr:DivIVA domain-containing protein [Plantactinospora sp. KLBMP9567]MDW5328683.1 DivIVA domain-containing protein [Plantactinospora sp. KLBMP9567]